MRKGSLLRLSSPSILFPLATLFHGTLTDNRSDCEDSLRFSNQLFLTSHCTLPLARPLSLIAHTVQGASWLFPSFFFFLPFFLSLSLSFFLSFEGHN